MPKYLIVHINRIVVCKIEAEMTFLCNMTYPSGGYGADMVSKEVWDSYNVGDTVITKKVKHGT